MHKLLQRQLKKSMTVGDKVDIDRLCALVSEAYDGLDLDQKRMDRANTLMSGELEALNSDLGLAAESSLEKNQWFEAAVNNMSQGLCLFDENNKLLVSNDRFAIIYGLDPAQIEVGISLEDILHLRIAKGVYVGNSPEEYLARYLNRSTNMQRNVVVHKLVSGQEIELVHQPLKNGGFLSTHEDVTERLDVQRKVQRLAHYDKLTGLPNRVKIHEELDKATLDVKEKGGTLAIFYVDLDGFKEINDTLGHLVGDIVLVEVGRRLTNLAGNNIMAGRLAGDEFLIIAKNFKSQSELAELGTKICTEVAREIRAEHNRIAISASVGISVCSPQGDHKSTLVQHADLALYRAKADGANGFQFFEEKMDAEARERRRLGGDLRYAVSRNELRLHYQPLLDLSSDRIIGYEALLRWQHPELGMISPLRFINIAEETGQICEIGEWALREACRYATTWPNNQKVAVNLSPVQFKRQDVVEMVKTVLRETGLAPDRLELEVTESVLIQNTDAVIDVFRVLRAMDVSIALDDFGTGYSSLSYLSRFPFHKIKIDKSFIDDLGHNSEITAIVSMIIGLGRSLNTIIIAEGIEKYNQHELLRMSGCTQGQGYLYGRPEPEILKESHLELRHVA